MQTRILIGTDEAGYGPNLGPLTITATAWEIPEKMQPEELWGRLSSVLTNSQSDRGDRLLVADSKLVYSAGDSLEDLEVPVLAFSRCLGIDCEVIDTLGHALAGADFRHHYQSEIWNSVPGTSLPYAASPDHIVEWQRALTNAMMDSGIRLLGLRSRIMFVKEFNERVAAENSKGAVLSQATLKLVRELVDQFAGDRSVLVVCDKHGGRNRYDELISAAFSDEFVFRLEESRARSRYRMGNREFCFRTRAEEWMPVALASMVSKYLREVLMHQFNKFWRHQIPGLLPTQGYPVDAKRFRADINSKMIELQIGDEALWRCR